MERVLTETNHPHASSTTGIMRTNLGWKDGPPTFRYPVPSRNMGNGKLFQHKKKPCAPTPGWNMGGQGRNGQWIQWIQWMVVSHSNSHHESAASCDAFDPICMTRSNPKRCSRVMVTYVTLQGWRLTTTGHHWVMDSTAGPPVIVPRHPAPNKGSCCHFYEQQPVEAGKVQTSFDRVAPWAKKGVGVCHCVMCWRIPA